MLQTPPPAPPAPATSSTSLRVEHYLVGWIAALPHELAVARALRDEVHDTPEDFDQNSHDTNHYHWGKIGNHNVVIATLPLGRYGTVAAATTAAQLRSSLPHLRFGLMVGIGAGIPKIVDGAVVAGYDIRLGDVVVSLGKGKTPGVVQHDFGKVRNGRFERIGALDNPPEILLKGLNTLRSTYEMEDPKIPVILETMYTKCPKMRREYSYQGTEHDLLFFDTGVRHHRTKGPRTESTVRTEIRDQKVERPDRDSTDAEVHFGPIASGNLVVKDAEKRADIVASLEEECICLEMEAAGLMDTFPCLVIRGICDYADAHENDRWQKYAAATAGAFAKELLQSMKGGDVWKEKKMEEVLGRLSKDISHLDKRFSDSATDAHVDRLYRWLQEPDPSTNYNAACDKRHEGTGTWLLQNEAFLGWRSCSTRSLWLHGFPGSGKTILSSVLIRHLKDVKFSRRPCLYFFFDFNNPGKQLLDHLVRSLFQQLLNYKLDAAFHTLTTLYEECSDGKVQPSKGTLIQRFKQLLCEVLPVDIVVDALDECTEQPTVLGFLYQLATEYHNQVRTVITSRRLKPIETTISKFISMDAWITVGGAGTEQDLRKFVRGSLKGEDFERWSGEHPSGRVERHTLSPTGLQCFIEDKVTEQSNGMFRLAALHLNQLRTCLTVSEVKETLQNLPDELFDMYDRMLRQVDKRHKPMVIRLLQFLLFSHQPLSPKEAVDAICVNPEKDPPFHPANRIRRADDLINLCPGLFEVTGAYAPTIQFSHASVKDFLTSLPSGHELEDSLSESTTQIWIARVCISYLSLVAKSEDTGEDVLGVKEFETAGSRRYPLHRFSAKWWREGTRVRAVEHALQDEIFHLLNLKNACMLVTRPGSLRDLNRWRKNPGMCWKSPDRRWKHHDRRWDVGGWHSNNEHPLILASQLGLAGTVSRLMSISSSHRPSKLEFTRALSRACSNQHLEVIQYLLGSGTDAGSLRIPFRIACQRQNLAVAKLLLNYGIQPSSRKRLSINSPAFERLPLERYRCSMIDFRICICTALKTDALEILQLLMHRAPYSSYTSASFDIFERTWLEGQAEARADGCFGHPLLDC